MNFVLFSSFFFFDIEINQKLQNNAIGASKVHSNNDQMNTDRSNTTGERKLSVSTKNKTNIDLSISYKTFD